MEVNNSYHGHTCKLYYNRYLWKVKLLIPCNEGKIMGRPNNVNKLKEETLRPVNSWLRSHCAGNYRLLQSWRKVQTRVLNVIGKRPKVKTKILSICNFTIFINNEANYLDIIKQFNAFVHVTYSPANKSHEDLIRDGNIIDVKNNLYFGTYRYKISFWGGGWSRRWSTGTHTVESLGTKELEKIIRTHLYNESESIEDQDYYLIPSNRSLYIKNKSDYTMIKLAMGEYIKKITVIALPNEVLFELIV
jgi:hypothetical protein